MASRVTINRRQLLVELEAAEPILKREAEQALRQGFFEPAVEAMKAEWQAHPVTNEIAGGAGAPNVSNTLEGSFREQDGDVTPNLWGFIGFDAKGGVTPEGALEPIARRLDPNDPDGPKMTYAGRDKDQLTYRFKVSAPDEEKLYNDPSTHVFWAKGLSWVKRIEQGLPGINHFLNVNRPSSRSGGGIQVDGNVRQGRFKPTSYMSRIFNNFLRNVSGRNPNGRSI